MKIHRLLMMLGLTITATCAHAGEPDKNVQAPVAPEPLGKGTVEAELLGGYFVSPVITGGGHRPVLNYAGGDFRIGVVVTLMVLEQTAIRGNLELLGDVLGDGVTNGAGNYITGASILARYNFIHEGSRFIPYLQIGTGGVHSDAAADHRQRLIGSGFEFQLEAALGVRYLIDNRWSVLGEAVYEHISNGDTASRNVGVNALGGRVGLGWIF